MEPAVGGGVSLYRDCGMRNCGGEYFAVSEGEVDAAEDLGW
jgi:hypothetical protein